MCYSTIIDSILENERDLIEYLDEDDILSLYDNDNNDDEYINEETVETIRVLINYGVNISLFSDMLNTLKNNENYENLNKDIVNEIIYLLENMV